MLNFDAALLCSLFFCFSDFDVSGGCGVPSSNFSLITYHCLGVPSINCSFVNVQTTAGARRGHPT